MITKTREIERQHSSARGGGSTQRFTLVVKDQCRCSTPQRTPIITLRATHTSKAKRKNRQRARSQERTAVAALEKHNHGDLRALDEGSCGSPSLRSKTRMVVSSVKGLGVTFCLAYLRWASLMRASAASWVPANLEATSRTALALATSQKPSLASTKRRQTAAPVTSRRTTSGCGMSVRDESQSPMLRVTRVDEPRVTSGDDVSQRVCTTTGPLAPDCISRRVIFDCARLGLCSRLSSFFFVEASSLVLSASSSKKAETRLS
mmetsp:Transcript_20018/g.61947  ORF Transcript_20018/g.61947 Transcript_20018/m.61947 type:complete len:262 (-) Transcript_20018:709-1494(-)